MKSLLFEVEPHDGHEEMYFARVEALRPVLARHRGLLFIDRFRALSDQNRLLSHSRWADEDAMTAWRQDATHLKAQVAGRTVHFKGYRLRVGDVVSYWHEDGAMFRSDGSSDRLVVVALMRDAPCPGATEAYQSVNVSDRFLSIHDPEDLPAARALLDRIAGSDTLESVLLAAVTRDYGLTDRAEAPQQFPASQT